VDFEEAEITGRWIESWEEEGVVFTPAHAPTRSKAKARLMFFPHISSGRKGILSATATDPIPVRARFPNGASSVTLVLWGSTACPARLEAYDQDGRLLDQTSLEAVPGRNAPDDPVPTFEMTVKGTHIAYIEFSGPREGEFLAADEVRFRPVEIRPVAAAAAQVHDDHEATPSTTDLKVLVFSGTGWFRHPDIPKINRWLVLLGHDHGFEVDVTENGADLNRRSFDQYDVLVLNNANELDKVLDERQRASVGRWFTEGRKGIVGLHAALVHQTNWPWFLELGGADFNSDSDFSRAKVIVDPGAKDHPTVKGQPEEFWIEADWTNHDRSVTGLPGFQVLLRVDESTYTPVREFFQTRGGKPMGDHPVAWTHEPASGGRFFYTEFGHDMRSLNTPFVRQHILEGILWSAGRPSMKE
jgi:cytochrome c